MSNNYDVGQDLPERTAERIAFISEVVRKVLPDEVPRSKRKNIIAEIAESYYLRNRQRYLDDPVNHVLTDTEGGDIWVRASYVKTYWSDIRDYLATQGITIAWNSKGIYRSNEHATIEEVHTIRTKALKKMSDRLTYRAYLFNKATDLKLPGIVTQVLALDSGD